MDLTWAGPINKASNAHVKIEKRTVILTTYWFQRFFLAPGQLFPMRWTRVGSWPEIDLDVAFATFLLSSERICGTQSELFTNCWHCRGGIPRLALFFTCCHLLSVQPVAACDTHRRTAPVKITGRLSALLHWPGRCRLRINCCRRHSRSGML